MAFTVCERTVRRDRFRALIRDLGFPPTTFQGLYIAGAGGWDRILAPGGATPTERGRLLCSLADVLLKATAEGQMRLESWCTAGRPGAPARESEWIERHLRIYGELSFLPRVIAALSVLPEAVRWIVVTGTAFLTVGHESIAWTSSAVLVDQDGRLRDRVIVLGPDADVDIVVHEIAHVWHAPFQGAHQAICAQGEAGIRALARAQGWAHRIDTHEAQSERLADGCATAWLLAARDGRERAA
jgi:hypothetical protein